MAKHTAIDFLKYMGRHGLDARVLQEYSQCGLLYCSKRCDRTGADLHRFVDFEGFDRDLIRKVDELETEFPITIFHIIQDTEDIIYLMCYDHEQEDDFQFNEFRAGRCTAIKYYTKTNEWIFVDLNYEVRLGSVVNVNFTLT